MKSTKVLLCLAIVCFPATGCLPEDLGGGLDIVNETGQTLYIYDTPIRPGGGRWRYGTSDCWWPCLKPSPVNSCRVRNGCTSDERSATSHASQAAR